MVELQFDNNLYAIRQCSDFLINFFNNYLKKRFIKIEKIPFVLICCFIWSETFILIKLSLNISSKIFFPLCKSKRNKFLRHFLPYGYVSNLNARYFFIVKEIIRQERQLHFAILFPNDFSWNQKMAAKLRIVCVFTFSSFLSFFLWSLRIKLYLFTIQKV